jgi:hypothetical protein
LNEYRVTKYDPAVRDSSEAYRRDEWTRFADIGRSFDGVELTYDEYERVENAYIATALAFLREAAVSHLTVRALQNARGLPIRFGEGDSLPIERISEVLRSVLREEFWCRLESSSAFVHVGWDYHMYLGVTRPCPAARRQAEDNGLFVEEFASPIAGIRPPEGWADETRASPVLRRCLLRPAAADAGLHPLVDRLRGGVRCFPPEDTGGVNWLAVFCGGGAGRHSCERERPSGGRGPAWEAFGLPTSSPIRSTRGAPSADRVTLAKATRIPPYQGS